MTRDDLFHYPYFVERFVGATSHFTAEEVGAYQRLLNWSWLNGPLSPDPDELESIMGKLQQPFEKVWAKVGKKFQTNGDGKLFNQKLEEVRNEVTERRERISAVRSKAARARWDAMQMHSNSNADGMLSKAKDKEEEKDLVVSSSPSPPPSEETTLVGENADAPGRSEKGSKDLRIDAVWRTYEHARSIYLKAKRRTVRPMTLTPKRRTLIRNALKTHGEEATHKAAAGIFLSDYHKGQNQEGREYLSPEIAFRMNATTDNIEKFAELVDQDPREQRRR